VTFRTRFAPSPTGPLHLGHAYSAMLGFDMAIAEGGEWLLRIEDIDRQRSRPEWERQIYEDLEWLGLWWPEPVMRQSERMEAYEAVLDQLWSQDAVFECTCSRADVLAAANAPQEGAPLVGPDGLIYPGTCRRNISLHRPRRFPDAALRLRIDRAQQLGDDRVDEGAVFHFRETGHGPNGEHGLIEFTAGNLIQDVGDVVLARRGMGTSYHLSVVLDDAAQGITHVVRGQDLFEATKIHVVLQKLLGLPTPVYHHHRLIRDETGRRLAKREDAKAIRRYRDEGATPQDIRRMVGL
jgi:glutamyl-Q tRNA(Asp) synthetase